MPLSFNNSSGIHADIPTLPQPTQGGVSGEIYLAICIIAALIIMSMVLYYLIVRIWGSPVLTAASSRVSGFAIIQHFQNSKIGKLLIAPVSEGAIRHQEVKDGTLITTPKGINVLSGQSFVNSFNLIGISIPTFLIGGISKLREMGIYNKAELETKTKTPSSNISRDANILKEAYNFDDFDDVLYKSTNPTKLNLQIEHVGDFIQAINQHYTESEITKEIQSYKMNIKEAFNSIILFTGITMLIIALAIYLISGRV